MCLLINPRLRCRIADFLLSLNGVGELLGAYAPATRGRVLETSLARHTRHSSQASANGTIQWESILGQ